MIGAVETGQYVQGYRHDLQTEENRHQVCTRGHQHHADNGKEDQRVQFAVVAALPLHVLVGDQDGKTGSHQEDHLEEGGKVVQDDRTAEALDVTAPTGTDQNAR